MIKSVIVTNYLGESITLELATPEKSGLAVLGIDGLGPSKADINMTELATSDGGLFNSSRVTSRNIVFRFKLLAKPTIEATRQLSYKYFPIKKMVHLIFETDLRIVETYGIVESNEPEIFDRFVTSQISVVCPDPYFYSLENKVTVFSGVEPMFDFPFSNESTSQNLIEVSKVIIDQEQTVYYDGDAEVGINIYIHALGPASNLTIYNTDTREVLKIDTVKLAALTGSGIIAGDDIIISTIKGQKSLTLLRNGEYINILNCRDRDSDWFQLTKGDNMFAFTATTGSTNLQFRIHNQIVYEGV